VETLLILAGVGTVLVFMAIQFGKSKERGKQSEKTAKVSKKMTKAVVNAPKTKDGLVKKIKKTGL
jgi:ribosomal protein S19E (S16A)